MQKATELGVTEITPLFTERTEVKLQGERLAKKIQHWQQICISACEQSQRNVIPSINSAVNFEEYIKNESAELKRILHHRSDGHLKNTKPSQNIALLIGPEGGLSDPEIESALSHGFDALTLGPRVLRTETAPIVALSVVQYQFGDI